MLEMDNTVLSPQERLLEERKKRILAQKEALKRKIIELNLSLNNGNLSWEEKEPIYQEMIQTQESLLVISGYYAKLLSKN
ncbi:MAG: hypothetical protein R3Y63_05315 [Eubacteriales bacterium]